MAKLSLSTLLASFGSISKLNANFQKIATAFENTVSRDGTSPNQMTAALDMNSQRILNLPSPVANNDPVRLVDVQNGLVTTALVIPSQTGNSGKYLTTNGTVVSWGTVSLGLDPTFNSLIVSGASNVQYLGVGGNMAVTGAVSFAGVLTGTIAAFSGNGSYGGSLTVSGACNLASNSLTVGGTQLVVSGGNVGVGTASPATKLHVVGSATIAGAAFTPVATVTVAGTTTVDATLSNVFLLALGTNIGTLNINNPSSGQTINLIMVQDGVGSRTVTWPASFKWSGGTAGVLSTGANKIDFLVATWIPSASVWAVALTKDFR